MEQWKPIEGYEGLYEVSSEGRVKSIERTVVRGDGTTMPVPERILKPFQKKDGYQQVILSKEGNRKTMYVHRLVANAFLENPENYNEVNHKDEDKTNNTVDNLEFCDRKYNINFGTRSERMVEKQRNSPKRSKPVQQLTTDGVFVREWPSTKECGRNGFDQGTVWSCCRGKRKQHKGFLWRYKEDASSWCILLSFFYFKPAST